MKPHQFLSPAVLAAIIAISSSAQAEQPDAMQGRGMMRPGLFMPRMDPAEGRQLLGSKGCVVCHSINGVGGTDAPALDADTMEMPMDPFEFAAKMWRGAPAMIKMQDKELGGQIEFTGWELADIIAFVHDPVEQRNFSEDDIPAEIKEHMEEDE